jgi:hypothetical protein
MRLARLLLVCSSLALALACSGNSGAGKNPADQGDTSGADSIAEGDDSSLPDVIGGGKDQPPPQPVPTLIQLALDPEKPVYKVKDSVKLLVTVKDQFGNEMPGVPLDAPGLLPAGIAEPTDAPGLKFVVEGMITATICVSGHPNVCASRDIWCDQTGPVIVVDEPLRGLMLSGDKLVPVSGVVTDAGGGMGTASVNGTEVALGPDGRFQTAVTSVQAMNYVDFQAADVFGNATSAMRSYLYSTQYHPIDAAQPDLSLVPDSLKVYTDDLLFYNPDPAAADNISYLLELVLQDLDLSTLLPNPVVEEQDLSVVCMWGKYDIFLDNIQWGTPQVTVKPVSGGLDVDVVIPDFYGEFSVETEAFACADFNGTASAQSIHVHAKVNIQVLDGGGLDISTSETTATLEGLDINLGGVTGFLLNWLIDLFSGTVAGMLEGQFSKMLEDTVKDLTAGITESLAKPIDIPLDPFVPGNTPILLQVLVKFTQALFDSQGGDLEANIGIFSAQTIGIDSPGALGRAWCLSPTPEEFTFDKGSPMPLELAAHIDVVNEALFALWNNGALHLKITSAALAEMGTDVGKYGVSNLDATTEPLLPPVVTTCTPDGALTAQIGDFYLEAAFDMLGVPTDVHMYLYLELAATISVVDGESGKEIGVVVGDPSIVRADLESINPEWYGKESMITGLITDTLVPMLLKSLKEKPLSIAMPAFNLGDLLGGDEGGNGGALSTKQLVLNLSEILNSLGYVHVRGGILINDAPPPEEPAQ